MFSASDLSIASESTEKLYMFPFKDTLFHSTWEKLSWKVGIFIICFELINFFR